MDPKNKLWCALLVALVVGVGSFGLYLAFYKEKSIVIAGRSIEFSDIHTAKVISKEKLPGDLWLIRVSKDEGASTFEVVSASDFSKNDSITYTKVARTFPYTALSKNELDKLCEEKRKQRIQIPGLE